MSVLALSTGSLYNYGIARVFELAARAGFDGVEVLIDERWDGRQPGYLRQLSERFELPIVALHSPFVRRVAGWPDDELGRLRRTLELAQGLDVPVVVAHLPRRFDVAIVGWGLDAAGRAYLPIPFPRRTPYYHLLQNGLADLEAQAGVKVGVENMPCKRYLWRDINRFWFNSPQAMERFSHVTLDTTHLGTWGLDPVAIYDQLRPRVVHVHLANFDGREHRLPPDGDLPLGDFLRRLARDDYAGAVSVEVSPDAAHAQDEQACVENLRRTVAFCREHLT